MHKFVLSLLITFMAVTSVISADAAQEVVSGVLRTEDNVCIAYDRYKNGFDSCIIICPGFYNSKENRWMQKTVDLLSSRYDVIIFDLRGHGKSGGKFTWSALEHMDINAILDYAEAEGYKDIGIVAFSLGAASAVNAVSKRDNVDGMVLISCPSSFRMIDYHFWKPEMFFDLKDNIECSWEGKGARATHIFMPKKKPIKTIGKIEHTPMLFIHGDKDWVVKDRHSRKLYDAAKTDKKLEIIKGGFHAERLVQFHPDRMQELMLDWFTKSFKKEKG